MDTSINTDLLFVRITIAMCMFIMFASCSSANIESHELISPSVSVMPTESMLEVTGTSIIEPLPTETITKECVSNKLFYLHTLAGEKYSSLFLACLEGPHVLYTQEVYNGPVGLNEFSASSTDLIIIRDTDNDTTYLQEYPSGTQQVIFGAADNVSGFSWSPNGEFISYVRSGENGVAIEILHVASHTISKIFEARVGDNTDLIPFATVWSPDGTKIATISEWGAGPYFHVVDVACDHERHICISEEVRQLSISELFVEGWPPSWTSDSSHLLIRCGEEMVELCLFDLDGKELKRYDLAQLGFETVRQPAVSPDGKFVAFSGNRQVSSGYDIFVVELDTLATSTVAVEPSVSEEGPVWGFVSH